MDWTRRSAVWLSALGIGLFQLVGSFGAADNQPERRALDAIAVALVLIGPIALALRDRWPVMAAVVATAAVDVYVARGHPYGPIFLSAIVGLVSTVLAGERRAAWLVAVAAYGGFIVASALDPRAEVNLLHLALVAGWLVVVLAVAELVKARRDQAATAERAAAEERQRRADEQRLTLAQELHDVLAHNISLINVQASVALHLIDEQPDQVRPALSSIKSASHTALQELRTALDVLRRGEAAPRSPTPHLADVEGLVDAVRQGGLDVHLDFDGIADHDPPLSAAAELAGYRIVQEALTNVTRHARARSASVRIERDGTELRVEVVDDGVGGVASAGNGIAGMRERAVALGGTLEAGPRPCGGFKVTARLPGAGRA